jgi:LmbE family N-acetylglucosaminyl deacetylase
MSAPRRFGSSNRPVDWLVPLVLAGGLLTGPICAESAAEPMTAQDTLRELRAFRELGSILYVAAHPDDENSQLIAYLARGRGYRTAYLSLTRGDGGQNVIGSEIFEELGVIRTQELLAARRVDGGKQFFTRAIDFGFSKSSAETLRIWDRNAVVSDIVRVIRIFRPDVIITRFSPQGGGHGHHTASAILAIEAYKLAGDRSKFPDQMGELAAWQPKRILQDGGDSAAAVGPGRGRFASRSAATIRFPANR